MWESKCKLTSRQGQPNLWQGNSTPHQVSFRQHGERLSSIGGPRPAEGGLKEASSSVQFKASPPLPLPQPPAADDAVDVAVRPYAAVEVTQRRVLVQECVAGGHRGVHTAQRPGGVETLTTRVEGV